MPRTSTTVVTVMIDGLRLNDDTHEIGDSVEVKNTDLKAIQDLESVDGIRRVKVAETKTLAPEEG